MTTLDLTPTTTTTTATHPAGTAAATTEGTTPSARGGSRIGPRLGAAALVIGAAGNTAQAVLSQVLGDRPDSIPAQVALANDHPTLLLSMCVVGTVAIPFMAIGFAAAAQELRRRLPRTGLAAGALLVLGMWGFLAIQISGLIGSLALLDADGTAAATWLDGLASEPLLGVLFGIPFMVGCVLGMLTLTIGLLVRGDVPRWIPAAWLVFILLDFSIGAVGPVDPHWLYLAGAVGLAVHLVDRSGGRRARA